VNPSALEIKGLFESISPFIESHTARVCPFCPKVCCANKHGTPEEEDYLLFSALDIEPSPAEGHPDHLCSLLGDKGCSLPRWQRPFRCTWYFCEPLLASMREEGGRNYREFVKNLDELVRKRQEFNQLFLDREK
jgi:hypothetical protein